MLPERFIETVVGFEIAEDLGGHGFLGGEGTAGDEAHHKKRRGDDEKEGEQGLEEARRDETEHGAASGIR